MVDEENGYLFDPSDYKSIANAITRLLALNEADYKHFCKRSRERAEKMLSTDVFVQSYIDLIEK